MDIYERLMQRQKENQPFLDFIGAVSEEVGPGRAVITLKPRPEHMNYRGIVHAIIMCLGRMCNGVHID